MTRGAPGAAPPREDRREPARAVLDVDLLAHVDALTRTLVDPRSFAGLGEVHRAWLLDRYLEIVPVVLPDALRCVVSGERVTAACHEGVRSSAEALRSSDIPFSVALRGGVPAVRAFGAFVREVDLGLSFCDTALLMGRAALIAQELGASWVDAWRASDLDAAVDGSTLAVSARGLDTADEDEQGPALEMVALAAAGRSTEQIAAATAYSPQAVKWHLGRLMRSWKVANRSALVAVALVRGALVASRQPPDDEQRPPA